MLTKFICLIPDLR